MSQIAPAGLQDQYIDVEEMKEGMPRPSQEWEALLLKLPQRARFKEHTQPACPAGHWLDSTGRFPANPEKVWICETTLNGPDTTSPLQQRVLDALVRDRRARLGVWGAAVQGNTDAGASV